MQYMLTLQSCKSLSVCFLILEVKQGSLSVFSVNLVCKKELNLIENPRVRHEGRALRLTKAHKPKAVEGEGIGSLSNNLVYTKKQKDIYANRKHETTTCQFVSKNEYNQPTPNINQGKAWIKITKLLGSSLHWSFSNCASSFYICHCFCVAEGG